MNTISYQRIGLYAGPVVFLIILFFVRPAALPMQGVAVMATTAWMAIWWLTEAVPIAVTALLPIILFPMTGGLDIKSTTAAFGDRFVFLYLGGFVLAIAIERWSLHKRIALNIIAAIGTNVPNIILGFMIASAFLSMWISNTATAVMMMPIAVAIVKQLQDNPHTIENENLQFGKSLMLAIAYSASIGGIATLIGTPPNGVLLAVVKDTYGIELSFAKWMMLGLPISLVLLAICWLYLTRVAFRSQQKQFPGGRAEIRRQLALLGKITYEEKWVMAVFAMTALLWITRSFLITPYLPAVDDTVIAMIAGVLLFILPSKENRRLLEWEEAAKLPWGILLLFGGGLALAEGFKDSGLALWIGTQMTLLDGMMLLLVVLVLVAAVNFLTEITSNLATTAMLLPILAPMAMTLDVHPYMLMVGATIAASCAFMLPVATPPNAVVFGSGYLRIPDMVRAGFWMNVFSIVVVTLFVYFVLPWLWGLEAGKFPASW